MFTLVEGTMGGGKTYYVVEQCLKAMKEGAIVHSNIAWRREVLEAMGIAHLHVELPENWSEWLGVLNAGEEGAENVWAVDEASALFHMYDQLATKGDQAKRELFQTMTMVRKAGLETYFITQHAGNVDTAIRNLAESRVMCVNQERLPFIGPIIAAVLGKFKRVRKNQVGLRLASTWHRYNPEVGGAYVTEDLTGKASKMPKRVGRVKPKEGVPVWVAAIVLLVVAVLCVGAYLSWKGLRKVTDPQEDLVAKHKAEQTKSDKNKSEAKAKEEPKAEPVASLFSRPERDVYKWGPLEFEQSVRIICSSSQGRGGLILRCLGGERLFVGGSIDGGEITSIVKSGGWYYVDTSYGQTVVCRFLTGPERLALYREVSKPAPQVNQGGVPPLLFGDAEKSTSTFAGQ